MTQLEAAADALGVEMPAADCFLCRRPLTAWLTLPGDWRKPRSVRPWRLLWCDSCSFGAVAPRPSPEELAAAYAVDDYYTHHAPQAVAAVRSLADRLRVKLAWYADLGVEAELAPWSLARHGVRAPASLCDVGCGNGGTLRTMAAAGFQVVGIEPDGDACRTANAAGLHVVEGSAENWPAALGDRTFDVVTMMHVLEHTMDPVAAVARIADALRPGGTFFVETPNNACRGLREAGIAWRWLDAPRHLNFFTPASLQAVCTQAGLEIAAVEYTGYARQFQHDWLSDEQEIHRRLKQLAAGAPHIKSTPLRPRNSAWRAMSLLRQTWNVAPAEKYDSVRVIARKR